MGAISRLVTGLTALCLFVALAAYHPASAMKKMTKMSVVSSIVLEGNQQIKAKRTARAMRNSLGKAVDVSEVIASDEPEADTTEAPALPDDYILPDHVKKLFKPYKGDLFSNSAAL